MNKDKIIQAWKDPAFRARLDEAERATLPAHPSGEALAELDEVELEGIAGGLRWLTGGGTTGHGSVKCSLVVNACIVY